MTVLDVASHSGRIALIVGAGSRGGIGYACSETLAALGASVVVADLPDRPLAELVASLPKGTLCSAQPMDVTDPQSIEGAVADVVSRHGRIDSLLYAAGVLFMEPFLEMTLEAWEETLAVNVTGAFLVGQAVARRMVKQETGGRIVLIGSNAGRVPRLSTHSYGASKAAIIQLARSMALELAPHGITVNALCPGSTATSMMVNVQAKGDPERLQGVVRGSIEQWRTGIPLGRLADPADQAAVAAFLLGEGGRHITGQALCVDGGQTFF